MTCAGTDKDVNEYFKNLYIMNFFNENYLNYTNMEDPIGTQMNWIAEKLNADRFDYGIFGVRLSKFESNDYRIYLTGE